MYKNCVIDINSKPNKVDSVWRLAETLSVEEKAELIERLLDQESGLIVLSATTHLADYILAQMSLLSSEGLLYVFRKVAAQLSSKGNGL
ncbi:MAG: hypothetical protein F6K50_49055 [Moorea sp. SIO3I7]|uniref:Uncharacterized protein n=2 Tax=Moorena TaxID=1155738 RepID=A0A1D8TXU1_9CYAN|nr:MULTISPECIES: hypothetical protein [Moorena]NEO02996.1 hypothetical protein [Moorena sp. SIO3I7]NEO64145.1 hypothetical protein [Moorena sp. SIO4G2]AOX02266.1 hypothetical protein BJP34_25005 [Moorena producens PAL-8-15-08-1]NEO15530.1 hypothetical protein [Moorena sp. SIO3E8]NEO75751.1 hypothetical protein [Moorena sp. SIO4G3]